VIAKFSRVLRNAQAVIATALFVALMRYVLDQMTKCQSQQRNAGLRAADVSSSQQEEIKRPAFLPQTAD
jgi:hypothetical protein